MVNKKFPVVFHAMNGKDDREASSPSFFNISEVQQIRLYVEALRSDRLLRVCKHLALPYVVCNADL